MIDQTPEERSVEDALTTAIQAANPGAIVCGWVIVAEITDRDDPDSSAYTYSAADGQSVALTLGLLDMGMNYHRARIEDI